MVSKDRTASEPRPEKVAVVDDVRAKLSSSNAALLTEYRGLTMAELAALRRSVGEAGGEYRIYKNTLARIAARELGHDGLDPMLTGPTAFAFVSSDAVAVARSLRDFARTNPKLVVKGGLLGSKVLTAADAGALADVAPREVQLAQLAGALAAPLRQMAGLLAAVPSKFAYGLAALIEQRGGAEAPAAVASEEAPEAAEVAPAPTSDTSDQPQDQDQTDQDQADKEQ